MPYFVIVTLTPLCHAFNWTELCQRYESVPSNESRKVYDMFLASNEIDMMEIRIMELSHVVDVFVISESRMTFRGHSRSLMFPHLLHRLPSSIIQKIHYTVLDHLVGENTWDREQYQRNQLFNLTRYAFTINTGDIIILSDCDEIPRPMFVQAMKHCQVYFPLTMESKLRYYSFNYVGSSWTLGPKAMLYSQGSMPTARHFRGSCTTCKIYQNTSWHCSSCFKRIHAFIEKIRSFSHTELDSAHARSKSNI